MENLTTQIIDEIISLDHRIRFVAIYRDGIITKKLKPGIVSFLTFEQTEKSIHDAIHRWKQRTSFSALLGDPEFAIVKYSKVFRITLSLPNDNLLLVSTETNIDPLQLIEKVTSVRNWYVF